MADQYEIGVKYDSQGNQYRYSNGRWRMVEDRSLGENLLIGAGETFTKLGRGVVQMGDFPEALKQEVAGNEARESEARQFFSEDNPISAAVGRALPYAATAPLSGGTFPGVAGVVGVDAGIGALEYANTPGERLNNALMAGAGTVGGFGVGAMAQRVASNIMRSGDTIAGVAARGGAQFDVPRVQPGVDVPRVREPGDGSGFLPGSVGAGQIREVAAGEPSNNVFSTFTRINKQLGGEGIDSPADARALLVLRENDFFVNPSSLSGNPVARMVFDWAERAPQGADIVADTVARPNIDNFNRLIFEAMGDDFRAGARVAELDSATVAGMREQAGALLDEIKLDAGFVSRDLFDAQQVQRITDSYQRNFKALGKTDPAQRRLDNIAERLTTGDGLNADELIELRSDVRELQLAKDGGEARALAQMVEVMDNALEEALSSNPASRFTIKDYRTAMARFRLARALDGPGAVGKDGKVSIKSLANQLKKNFIAEYGANDRFGTFSAEQMGDAGEAMSRLFDVTKALNRFPRYLSDSGTSQRLSIPDILQPETAAFGALTRLALPRWIERAQLSPDQLREIIEQLGAQDAAYRAAN